MSVESISLKSSRRYPNVVNVVVSLTSSAGISSYSMDTRLCGMAWIWSDFDFGLAPSRAIGRVDSIGV